MIDSTAIRATRAASGAGEKRRPQEPVDHALDRSRGGLTTKIHMLCDANGIPLSFVLTPGQASDISDACSLLDKARIPGGLVSLANVAAGRSRTKDMMPNTCVSTAIATGSGLSLRGVTRSANRS